LILSNPSVGAAIGTLNPASITVVKNPVNGIFTFSQGSYRFDGDGNIHVVTVVRNVAPTAATAYVELADGTGFFNIDYFTQTTTTGTGQVIPVKFAAGQTSATFTIGEPTGRGNNNMTLALVDASVGSAVGMPNTAPVSFFDEATSRTLVEISPPEYWLTQSATQAMIRVVRTGTDTSGIAAVGYTTVDGTGVGAAVSGTDYTLTSGTLTFGPGIAFQDILVPVKTGTAPLARDRNFSLILTSATGTTVTTGTTATSGTNIVATGTNGAVVTVGALDTATINIIKTATNGVFALSATNYVFDTDNYNYNIVTVTRTGTGKAAVVYVQLVDGTALSGSDYFTNGNLIGAIASTGGKVVGDVVAVNFTATQTTGTFGINAPVGHGDKSMTVRLIGTEAGNAIGNPSSATVQFLDLKDPSRTQGVVEFSPVTYRENQAPVSGGTGSALLTVVRSGSADFVAAV